ncbi:hypothetical protein NHX12_015319 [Muraenolepis orangiensis]|uniref:Ig-like domain-containing protein n=1 Tax=Muraenolepis orangiensis TaxID=630683 RepID=A0A9Q0D9N0_9TELE|nr:hypothetical protein NHX12_015319 [Muraenolepis orangiensis]
MPTPTVQNMTELDMLLIVFLMAMVLVSEAPQLVCVFGGSCVLPCHFQPDINFIHWVNKNGVHVHSFYDNKSQLKLQSPLYQGRTSLFLNQISGVNASLRLSKVNLQDQGRYTCYTSTLTNNNETFVTLTVRAPVARVNITLLNPTVTCKSGGIYPRPELTWSVSPRPATTLQNTTEVHEDDRGLFDISGSLRTVSNDTEWVYSCSVQSERSARKATTRQNPPMQSASYREVSLPCDGSALCDITWTFKHNQTILTKPAGGRLQVEKEWEPRVKELSESGRLLLSVTSSAESQGTYTCTLSYPEETDVTTIELILEDHNGEGSQTLWFWLFVLPVFLVIIFIIFYDCIKKNMKPGSKELNRENNSGTDFPLTRVEGAPQEAEGMLQPETKHDLVSYMQKKDKYVDICSECRELC